MDWREDEVVPRHEITEPMATVAEVARRVAHYALYIKNLDVRFVRSESPVAADWAPSMILTFNARRLGTQWFDLSNLDEHIALIVREIAHLNGTMSDSRYIMRLCDIASKLFKRGRRTMLADINHFA